MTNVPKNFGATEFTLIAAPPTTPWLIIHPPPYTPDKKRHLVGGKTHYYNSGRFEKAAAIGSAVRAAPRRNTCDDGAPLIRLHVREEP